LSTADASIQTFESDVTDGGVLFSLSFLAALPIKYGEIN